MPQDGQRRSSSARARAGFTLLELLTALIVLGIASTIFIKMFTSSQSLAKSGRSHEIAAELAQEQLTLLQRRPDLFKWPNFADEKPGTALPVKVKDGGALLELVTEPPSALPLQRRAHDREEGLYRDYAWTAHATLPGVDAHYIELTVNIQWELEGRVRSFMLTSAMPRPEEATAQ